MIPRLTAIAFALTLLAAHGAAAQGYPNRPVTLLVPQAPGASSDLLARTLASACRRSGDSRW